MSEIRLQTEALDPRFATQKTSFTDSVAAGFDLGKLRGNRAEMGRHSEVYGGWSPVLQRAAQGNLPLPPALKRSLVDQNYEPDSATIGQLAEWARTDGRRFDLGDIDDTMTAEAVEARRVAVYERDSATAADLQRELAAGSGFGNFVGAVGAEFTDPLNVGSMAVGAPARAGILATAAIEAGINAVIEGASTQGLNLISRRLGLEETSVGENMLVGAVFGAGVGGGVKIAQKATGRLARMAGGLVRPAADKRALSQLMSQSEDPEIRRLAAEVSEDATEQELGTGSGAETLEAVTEHESRTQAVQEAFTEGSEADIPDRPVTAVPARSDFAGGLEEVDPRDLLVDPETFQFKSEASGSQGLTSKLKDVPVWRSERAGVVLVYEDAGGQRFIADGHQRTGLARRIMEQDPGQEIRMAAKVYREADGFSPMDIRIAAAVKNIAEAADGMTAKMAVDAAKVLRIDPAAIRELPAGPGIKRANELSRLSDDAFQLLINDVIPDNFAALIGRLVDDIDMHLPVARLLEKVKPDNEAQAEAVIRQSLTVPVNRETTEDLFGTQVTTESLFLERARVLERSLKDLRNDERIFRTLTDQGDTIEGRAGNKLDAAGNQANRKLMQDAMAAIQKLAYRAGPISEALNDGAKNYKENGRLGDAAGKVISAITEQLDRDGIAGLGTGRSGRDAEPANTGAGPSDNFEEFGEPAGAGADAQIAATRIETDINEKPAEAFSSDEEARRDLGKRVSAGASRDELDNHPAVVKAIEEMEIRAAQATNLDAAYGTDEWLASREYVFPAEQIEGTRFDSGVVQGTEAALAGWIARAEAFAGKEGPRRDRVATILLGPPAAGKSTIAESLALTKRSAIVDADEVKKTLPEFEGGIGAAAVHKESSDLSKMLFGTMMADGTNIVFPKVGDDPASIRKVIKQMKAEGYTVELVNMAVSSDNAYQRMIGRFVSKGRLIPPDYFDSVGEKPSATYATIRSEGGADGFANLDNNGGFKDPKPVLEIEGQNPLAGSEFDIPADSGRGGGTPDRGDGEADGETAGGTPETQSEITPAGSQMLIDGVEPISAKQRIQSAADAPLIAQTRTTDSEIGGMFDANDPARVDLFDQVPVGIRDVDGEMKAETVSRAELAEELDADDEFADQLGLCLR